MQLRRATASLLIAALALSALGASPGQAGRPEPVPGVLPSAPAQAGAADRLPRLESVCRIGVTGEPHLSMMYLYPPDDEYYTLLNPAACACGAGFTPLAAHVTLNFDEPCSIPVSVAVVAADLSNPSCPTPIPGQYLCPLVDQDLTATEAGLIDMTIPLPPGCCITQPAFLLIIFREVGDCGGVPGLVTQFLCDPCVSWNAWPGGALLDLCDGYLLGNPIMSVEATCCATVPALPDTWSNLKAMYR